MKITTWRKKKLEFYSVFYKAKEVEVAPKESALKRLQKSLNYESLLNL